MFSIAGWWRRWRLRLTGKELIITGNCRQCGACCQRLQLEYKNKWLRSKRQFYALATTDPEFARFAIIGRDRSGLLIFNCHMLDANNQCSDYANRPHLCRDFPNKGIFFCGGALPQGCGYTLGEGIPFAKILSQQEQLVQHPHSRKHGGSHDDEPPTTAY